MDKIKYKPLDGYIIVQKVKPPEKTKTGIGIPTGSQEKEYQINFGIVLRVSDTVKDIKAGEKIQWKEYVGAPIFGEKDLFVVDAEDREVLYILEE